MWRQTSPAYSLAEVLLALGLLSIALLALVGQSTLLVKSNQKADDRSIALDLSRQVIERASQSAETDNPAGRNADIFNYTSAANPFVRDTERIGFTDYDYELYITDVTNQMSGSILGSGPTGTESTHVRLKLFQAKVYWWNGETQSRTEYGKLEVETSRLIKVTANGP
ncbi:MAG: hypothetical protein KC800_33090 [Candidatus Eremiobacteraeota bacterium]|nr:hypothetical protein [Candidatus Eremiobacteraeota bacterium]